MSDLTFCSLDLQRYGCYSGQVFLYDARPHLDAFTELRKATVSFVMCVCPSCRMGQLGSHGKDFHKILYLSMCRKSVQKVPSFIKNWQEWQIFYIMAHVHFWYFNDFSLRMRNVYEERCREIKTYFLFSNFFPENRAVREMLWENVVGPDRLQNGACALHAGSIRLQTRTQNM